jgi:hypothetical protein
MNAVKVHVSLWVAFTTVATAGKHGAVKTSANMVVFIAAIFAPNDAL